MSLQLNKENIDKVIAIVQRAAARNGYYHPWFQSDVRYRRLFGFEQYKSEAEMIAAKGKGNVGGLVALSQEWKDDHGTFDVMGEPIENRGTEAKPDIYVMIPSMGKWLGIEDRTVGILFLGYEEHLGREKPFFSQYSYIFSHNWNEVTPADVVRVFAELRDNGEIKFLKRIRNDLFNAPGIKPMYKDPAVRELDAYIYILERIESGKLVWP